MRAYLESTKGWQDMLSSAVKYLRVAGIHNVNARKTKNHPSDDVRDCLNQDFAKSWSARNGLDEENRFISLVRTLVPEFYDNAHAYQHGADNSDTCCVPHPTKVVRIGTCVIPQFTDYVDVFRLEGVDADVMTLRVRLTSGRDTIFTSSSPVGPTTPPMSSSAADPVGTAQSRPGQP